MYTQTEKSKTNQLKANEKFLKDFSAYRTFPDRAENANLTIDENISLKYIKNDQLLLQTKNLVQKERQINIQVLQHLQEIEKRKLYLDRGFPSLFEYAVKELGYSHSAAYRRIKTMRLCRDIPQAVSKIKTGSLNLTTASQLQTFFEKKKRKDREAEKTLKTRSLEECDLQSTSLPAAGCVKENEEQDSKTLKNSSSAECNLRSTFLPAAGCVKENEEQDSKTLKNSSSAECNLRSTFLPAAGCVKENEEQDSKTLKNSSSAECNLRSTSLPAAECVKENEEQDKKTPVQLNSNQKLDLIQKAENQSSRELEKTLFDIDSEVNHATKEKIRNIKNGKVEMKVILDKKSQAKLEVLKKLLSHKNPNMSYGELFSVLAEVGLNKYDPKRKIKKQSSAKKQAAKIDKQSNKEDIFDKELRTASAVKIDKKTKNNKAEVVDKKLCKASAMKIDKQLEINKLSVIMQSKEVFDKKPRKTSTVTMKQKIHNDQKYLKPKRYIPSKVRHHVWMRDQGKCTYVCPKTKRRCISDHLLQIDHIKPFSLGGTNEADNLRLLCANHNQFMFTRYQKYR